MPQITCRFYEELNDFLPLDCRKREFSSTISIGQSVKDKIESLGIPHTEVDLILVNGQSVGFDHGLRDGDRMSVFPMFESLDITGLTRLRQLPLRKPRFMADHNIRDVVKMLRALGLDVIENKDLSPAEMVGTAISENRILLTGNRQLLKLKRVTHGIFVRQADRENQVQMIVRKLCLEDLCKPFSRCLLCNTGLLKVKKDDVWDRIPPKVRNRCHEFARCPVCDRLYWKGTHYQSIQKRIDRILGAGEREWCQAFFGLRQPCKTANKLEKSEKGVFK